MGVDKSDSSTVIKVVVVVTGVVSLGVLISRFCRKNKPSSKNPFIGDTREPAKDFEFDKSKRDLVLKNGYTELKLVATGENFDVIVIGSGIGGLTTAAILSRAGKKVLILEQHDQCGGCCHSFTEKGFEFDTGECFKAERILLFEQYEFNIVLISPPDNVHSGIHYIGECRNNTGKGCNFQTLLWTNIMTYETHFFFMIQPSGFSWIRCPTDTSAGQTYAMTSTRSSSLTTTATQRTAAPDSTTRSLQACRWPPSRSRT